MMDYTSYSPVYFFLFILFILFIDSVCVLGCTHSLAWVPISVTHSLQHNLCDRNNLKN